MRGVGSRTRSFSAGRSMRVPGIQRGELALTHFARGIPRTFHPPLRPLQTPTLSTIARMASAQSGPDWTAQRVRDTFLDYFKQNGHTFGAFEITTPPCRNPSSMPPSAFDVADQMLVCL